MKNIKKTIHDLLKGKNTILIESMCKDATIYIDLLSANFEYDRRKTTPDNLLCKDIMIQSLTDGTELDFVADVEIHIGFGYEGSKYSNEVHTKSVSVKFGSRILITNMEKTIGHVRPTKAIKRAIENLILNKIVIK